MKLKKIIKKYRNFIVVMIISMLVGGILGGYSNKISNMDLSYSEAMSNFLFKALFAISIIITIYLIVNIIYIKANYMKVDLDNIPKVINRKVTNVTLLCTIQVIIGLVWDAIVVNNSFDKGLLYLIMVPTIFIVISGFLLTTNMNYSNYLYPNRKMNLFENGAGKKYFDKLDDGEKWVTYISSYTTFNKMQIVYAVALVISILLSMFVNVPISVPIIIGVIWIIQDLIHSLEAKKYEQY